MKISVIIPCHNAAGKIGPCLDSLRAQSLGRDLFEVIFVDDCSTDDTVGILRVACRDNRNWRVITLEANSGSPSRPRNVGVAAAAGEYVFYLDCDDELFPDTLASYLDLAGRSQADLVRGYLVADDGVTRKEMNRLPVFAPGSSKQERAQTFIGRQSTTVCQLVRTSLLRNNGIAWPETLRMGEDTLFMVDVLVAANVIEYIDHPTFVYHKAVNGHASSTQTYGARELRNHLAVWGEAERRLAVIGISYLELRLRAGLQSVLLSLTRYYTHDIPEELFLEFCAFIDAHQARVRQFPYGERLKSILGTVYQRDFQAFLLEIRPRLVIAGYDLKFIRGAIPELDRFFAIRIDEWTGHDSHDQAASRRHLDWAEIIFCEWLLGNAVWYSENKRPDQRLIVRVHRFELTTPWCQRIDHAKVDRFIAVSVYFVEKVIERVGCPRGKVVLVPNYIDTRLYEREGSAERVYNLAMIGILPRKKGYRQGLEVLRELVAHDVRYNLTVFGKLPAEVPWLAKNADEMSYYDACEQFIAEHCLGSHVRFAGWVDVTREMKNIGFVLSTSEKDELFESFHLAPADGFAGGGVGLMLPWNGVEYIYPAEFLCADIDTMVARIRSLNTLDALAESSTRGREFIDERYSVAVFCALIRSFTQ